MVYFQFLISACLQAYRAAAHCSEAILTGKVSPDCSSTDNVHKKGTYLC